ncbi:AraC family transcriptional regulator [Necropsobacter rosorum]|uniref:cupin domain-containing protein n=1 Tax=Necropsobacter rosorum TaxID=908285 RepID=UPI000509E65F
MDILEQLISLAQVSGQVDIQCRLQGSWYMRHEAQTACAIAHIVTQGSGYLKIDGQKQPHLLKAGDVIFFPRAVGHTLSDRIDPTGHKTIPQTTQNGAFILKHSGDNSPDFSLFCARFDYEPQAELFSNLPQVIFLHIDAENLLTPLIKVLQNEAETPSMGATLIIHAISSVLLVSLLRAYMQQGHSMTLSGTLNGWQDRRLRRLIQMILTQPEQNWSVEQMTHTANLSRAQLMRLFKQKMAVSPHAFVHKTRLQKAAQLLKQSNESILSIALSCGFQSETHFGKAFKKHYHITPGHYRKLKK